MRTATLLVLCAIVICASSVQLRKEHKFFSSFLPSLSSLFGGSSSGSGSGVSSTLQNLNTLNQASNLLNGKPSSQGGLLDSVSGFFGGSSTPSSSSSGGLLSGISNFFGGSSTPSPSIPNLPGSIATPAASSGGLLSGISSIFGSSNPPAKSNTNSGGLLSGVTGLFGGNGSSNTKPSSSSWNPLSWF